jgi:L-threonylcarbamoyladenylate synthase
VLRGGGCVGLPTETVYGLAADGLDPRAVARVFEIKGRPSFDPLIYHVHADWGAERVVAEVPAAARRLMEVFWPGALTIVLPKRAEVPELGTSGLPTVAVRCPAHPVAQAVLREFGGPLAAPSANRFGRISPTTAAAVAAELGDAVELILDGGPCVRGVESTIVEIEGEGVRVLRPGAVTLEELARVVENVRLAERASPAVAPGMLAHHYAPRTPLYLAEEGLGGTIPAGSGLLVFQGKPRRGAAVQRVLSERGDLAEAAVNLFGYLRSLDGAGMDRIVAEAVPEVGLGVAINDRLRRAAAGRARWDGKAWEFSPRAD